MPRHTFIDIANYPATRSYLSFIAPEVLRDSKQAGESSDIFSLAAVLFSLVYHKFIYSSSEPPTPEMAAKYHIPTLPANTKPLVQNFFATTLSPSPQNRYQSIVDFQDILQMIFCLYRNL